MLPRRPFYFLRHGETDWNRLGLYQGRRDVPLNATGLGQARRAADRLARSGIARIVSSPLARAHATAEIVARPLGLAVALDDRLLECAFGVREGQAKAGASVDDAWRSGVTPDGAERYRDFRARVLAAMADILAGPGPVLVVAHRAVFWPIEDAAGLPPGGDLPNAWPVSVGPEEAGWSCRPLPGPGAAVAGGPPFPDSGADGRQAAS